MVFAYFFPHREIQFIDEHSTLYGQMKTSSGNLIEKSDKKSSMSKLQWKNYLLNILYPSTGSVNFQKIIKNACSKI